MKKPKQKKTEQALSNTSTMASRDLTKLFIETRMHYQTPAFNEYHSDDDDDLRYSESQQSRKLTEDIELGDNDQFEKQPAWVLILKGVQENISNIKNGCKFPPF